MPAEIDEIAPAQVELALTRPEHAFAAFGDHHDADRAFRAGLQLRLRDLDQLGDATPFIAVMSQQLTTRLSRVVGIDLGVEIRVRTKYWSHAAAAPEDR